MKHDFVFDLQRFAAVTTFDIERDRRAIDVTKRIAEERPDISQFMVLLMRARKRQTQNSELIWWDDRPWAVWAEVTTAASDSDTVITVDDATVFRPKDTVLVTKTMEQIFVTDVNYQTNTLTVIRGYGQQPAAPIAAGDKLMWLANAMEQFSRAPESKIAQPTKRFNYTQTVRTTFDESMQSATDALVTSGTERQRLRRKKLFDHRAALERTAIWGQRLEDPVNRRHLTGGINSFIVTNEFDFGGNLDEKVFFTEFTEMAFAYGENTDKVLLTSPAVLVRINEFAREKIETTSGEDTYGLKLRYIQTTLGRLFLVPSRTFEHDFAGWGFVLDMEHIYYRPKTGRDTKLYTNIQENDADGWRDEYLTEFAMQVELEKNHVRFINAL